eukprot:Pgem_evm1s12695
MVFPITNLNLGLVVATALTCTNSIVSASSEPPLSTQYCFSETERVQYDTKSTRAPIIRLNSFDYVEATIMTEFASILLNEKLGIKTKTFVTPHTDTYLTDIATGIYHANLANYGYEGLPNNVDSAGGSGYYERPGWYVPSYMLYASKDLAEIGSYVNVYNHTKLFCQETSREYEHSNATNIYDYSTYLQSKECTDNKIECVDYLSTFFPVDKKCKLQFYSYPDSTDWGQDSTVVTGLGLDDVLDGIYVLNDYPDVIVSSDQIMDELKAVITNKTMAYEPFMVSYFSPSGFLSKNNPNGDLFRVTLPEDSASCKDKRLY